MLQSMHEKVQGWLAHGLIIIICLSFALWGIQSYLHGGFGQHTTVAKVGSRVITTRDLAKSVAQARHAYESKRGVLTDEMLPEFKRVVLNRMVQEAALKEALQSFGFAYSDAQVRDIIKLSPAFKQDGVFASTRLAAYLRQSNQTIEQLAAGMGNRLMQMQFQSGVLGSSFATEKEVDRFARWITQRRDYRYVVIQPSALSVSSPTQKEIADYYHANKDQFVQPEQVAIDYVMLTPKAAQSQVKVSHQQIQAYYQDNLAMFHSPVAYHVVTLPVGKKAHQLSKAAVTKRLASGHTLTQLARSHQGHVKWLPYATLDKGIQAVLGQLIASKEPTLLQLSGQATWVQVLEKRAGRVLPLTAVKQRILNQLRSQGVSRVLAKKQELLTNVSYIHPNSLVAVAKAAHLTIQSSPYFPRQGGKGVLADPAVVKTAWSDPVRLSQLNSNVIHLTDGSLMVLRLQGKKPRQALPLKQVTDRIQTALRQKSKELQASLLSVKLAKLLRTHQATQVAALMHRYHLKWVAQSDVLRSAKSVVPAVHQKAFALKAGGVGSVALANRGSAVVHLKAIQTLHSAALHKLPNYSKLTQAVMTQYARLSMLALFRSATGGIATHIDESLLDKQ